MNKRNLFKLFAGAVAASAMEVMGRQMSELGPQKYKFVMGLDPAFGSGGNVTVMSKVLMFQDGTSKVSYTIPLRDISYILRDGTLVTKEGGILHAS